jgi:hypothetical protein
MKQGMAGSSPWLGLMGVAAALVFCLTTAHAAEPPLELARDGFMYVGGKTMQVDGREYF